LLLDERNVLGAAEDAAAPIQLLEDSEYRYRVEGPGQQSVRVHPDEVFDPDSEDGRTGRLRTRLRTGSVLVRVMVEDTTVGQCRLEVRARKLGWRDEYRWMMRDLTRSLTEIVLQRFAASEVLLTPDYSREPATLYQRFALLAALLEDDALTGAIEHVMARPHTAWRAVREEQAWDRGAASSSDLARQIARGGPGRRAPDHLPISRLPRTHFARRDVPDRDTPPNRFVKFALQGWLRLVNEVEDALELETRKETAPVTRGRLEVARARRHLEALLARPFFAEIGALDRFPGEDTVLQQRAGYRAVFRAFWQSEVASKLTWESCEDSYHSGQRDVATLYEYWVFLTVLQVVESLCDASVNRDALFTPSKAGLTLRLARGTHLSFTGMAHAGGHPVRIDVHYNQTFSSGAGSWTAQMKPDVALCLTPQDQGPGQMETWVHFDAKYRARDLGEDEVTRWRRDDLIKMHAYRDAIVRSAGAYVLYPGERSKNLPRHHELLPGLGAFALRPTAGGEASGVSMLRGFLAGVLEHVGDLYTQRGRARYWAEEAYTDPNPNTPPRLPTAPFLERPPEDTLVTLGFVKTATHDKWIAKKRWYNLRAGARRGAVALGARELAADLVVTYGEGVATKLWRIDLKKEIQAVTDEDLREMDYPEPGGQRYMLVPLAEIEEDVQPWLALLTTEVCRGICQDICDEEGAPVSVSWARLVKSLQT